MRTFYLTFILLLLSVAVTRSQNSPIGVHSTAGSVSPSAEASAMARIAEIPVNYYTGIPQISYPIYNFNQYGLALSIGLNYFAGGHKVEEMATNTGLGWSLSAGGVIIRTVRGLPDDYPVKGYMYADAIPTSPGSLLDSFYRDKMDAELDVFQFSLNGRPGKFYMGKNNKILIVPDAKLKIETVTGTMTDAPASTIISFSITAEDGTRYVFKDRELSKIQSTGDSSVYLNKFYVSAWYISDIVTPYKEDSIHFNYTNRSTLYTSRVPEFTVTDPNESNKVLQNSSRYLDVYVTSPKITRIDLPDKSTVNFIYDTKARCDQNTDFALRKIEIRDTELRKGVLLDYQYSTPTGYISYRPLCTGIAKERRLMLRQITEYTGTTQLPPTIYEYEKDVVLPSRDSRSIDYWGYYNGKENTTLVPPYGTITTGADRSPDFYYARAGCLRKIYHPTGGYTLLEYEGNENFSVQTEDKSLNFYYADNVDLTMNINKLFTNHVGLTFKLTDDAGKQYFRNNTSHPGTIQYTIYSSDKTSVISSGTISIIQLSQTDIYITMNLPYNGNYIARLAINNFTSAERSYLSLAFTWKNDVVKDDQKIVGGLRIKRQTAYDGLSHNNDIVTEYKYVNENGKSSGYDTEAPIYYYRTGVTADKYYPADVRMSEPFNGLTYVQGSPSGYARVEVISGTPEKNNGRVVYEFTSLKDLMDGDTPPWFYQNYTDPNSFPFIPKDKADWMLGLPTVTSTYGPDGKITHKTINYYTTTRINYTYADFKCLRVGVDREILTGTTRTNNYVTKEYYPLYGNAQLNTASETIYYNNGTSKVSQTNYTYDPTYLTIKKVITDYDRSKGLKLEKAFYYPYDYTVSGGIASLKTAGIFATIATETWLTGNGVSKLYDMNITDYKVVSGTTMVRPSAVYQLYAKAPLESTAVPNFSAATLNRIPTYVKQKASFDAFNSKGNTLQITNSETGIISSNILDDVFQTPIALATNATISEIAYTSFESDTKGQWTYSGAPQANATAATGIKDYVLSNGTITKAALPTGKNYLMSFWTKSGTVTVSGGTLLNSVANSATGWELRRYKVAGGTAISISGTARIDELRIYPEVGTMETSCYVQGIGKITSCDITDRIMWYDFDGVNRLQAVRDQDRNIVKWNEYNTIQPAFENDPLSQAFVKNCPGGEGSTVTYNIAAGKYKSYISKDDANDMAQEDMRLYGQEYANTNGTCTWWNQVQSQDFTKACTTGYKGSVVKYTVAAHTYSSNISLNDANNKALAEITAYGQTNANTVGTCMPGILYIKFALANRKTTSTSTSNVSRSTTTVDLVVSFFSDAACTIPYSVSGYNVYINVKRDTESFYNGTVHNSTVTSQDTYSCNGSVVTVATGVTEKQSAIYDEFVNGQENPSPDYDKNTYTYTVAPNANYIVK